MELIETARRLARLGAAEEALRAYLLVLEQDSTPEELLEAAAYHLEHGGDTEAAYTAFIQLYNAGYFRGDLLPLLQKAFYEPARAAMKKRYEENCALLGAYPYVFRRDFVPFDELPLAFYPYGDGYVPFSKESKTFGDYYEPDDPAVSRNFFHDLEKPVLAEDIYSQYELEYLNDNVRPSEWVGRENHVYLHYADWGEFCAYLQALSMEPLLADQKFVFLIGDERELYPIDFRKRFGIDYKKYPVRPISFREIHKLIWHTQFLAHNGGDFFNEIFDGHPNLLFDESVMFDELEAAVAGMRTELGDQLSSLTDKDILAAYYLNKNENNGALDPAARIVPALFFQPHFQDPRFGVQPVSGGCAVLKSNVEHLLHTSSLLKDFKYIKTFTPLRRPTSSHGGTLRFIWRQYEADVKAGRPVKIVHDILSERILNRAFLRDPDDRFYHDSVIVRFEDGKTNPKATFSALAAFLDLPYTESMTYGSLNGDRDPYHMGAAYANGFGTWSLNNRYDDFENDAERYFLECFLCDVYSRYGYDFLCYDGAEMDEARVQELIRGFAKMDSYIRESCRRACGQSLPSELPPEEREARIKRMVDEHMEQVNAERMERARILLSGLQFVNRRGIPLEPTPMLEPDPALLEREIYH